MATLSLDNHGPQLKGISIRRIMVTYIQGTQCQIYQSIYIVEISYIGRCQYDFFNRKSIDKKIGKIVNILVIFFKKLVI